jgi:hypothetical protein
MNDIYKEKPKGQPREQAEIIRHIVIDFFASLKKLSPHLFVFALMIFIAYPNAFIDLILNNVPNPIFEHYDGLFNRMNAERNVLAIHDNSLAILNGEESGEALAQSINIYFADEDMEHDYIRAEMERLGISEVIRQMQALGDDADWGEEAQLFMDFFNNLPADIQQALLTETEMGKNEGLLPVFEGQIQWNYDYVLRPYDAFFAWQKGSGTDQMRLAGMLVFMLFAARGQFGKFGGALARLFGRGSSSRGTGKLGVEAEMPVPPQLLDSTEDTEQDTEEVVTTAASES